ncbi:hypothetical protein DSO57_1023470 [Entomophthora muscae]|uniref:Uncharacterized protein n=1 Tax=Entomophthora muscae TaxID=34485 RepID=A0ACC2TQ53_9FUNG|nr:hypothetical protein DSO57_1023470 [Entomophthora muscae]
MIPVIDGLLIVVPPIYWLVGELFGDLFGEVLGALISQEEVIKDVATAAGYYIDSQTPYQDFIAIFNTQHKISWLDCLSSCSLMSAKCPFRPVHFAEYLLKPEYKEYTLEKILEQDPLARVISATRYNRQDTWHRQI